MSNKYPEFRLFYYDTDKKAHEIGAAWCNKSGNGYNIKFDVLPVAGQKISMFPA